MKESPLHLERATLLTREHTFHRLFVLFVVGTLCLATFSSATTYCSQKNPFIPILASKGVRIFREPLTSPNSTCSSEWNTHQTCCESSSLISYASSATRTLGSSIENVRNELITTGQALQEFLLPVGSIWNQLNASASHQNFSTDLNKLQQFTDSLIANSLQDNNLQTQCFSRMNQMRTRSLCMTCSGRSQIYFSANKARIKSFDCKQTIQMCAHTWNKIVQMVDAMTLADGILKTLKILFPNFMHSFDMSKGLPLEQWIQSSNIRAPIQRCMIPTLATCDTASSKSLCQNLITIQKQSFTEVALSTVASQIPQLNELKTASISLSAKLKISPAMLQEANDLAESAGDTLYQQPVAIPSPAAALLSSTLTSTYAQLSPVAPAENIWNLARRRMLQADGGNTTNTTNLMSGSDDFGGDVQVADDRPEGCSDCMNMDGDFP